MCFLRDNKWVVVKNFNYVKRKYSIQIDLTSYFNEEYLSNVTMQEQKGSKTLQVGSGDRTYSYKSNG